MQLPDDVTFDQPGNPLDRHPTWKHVACPGCGGAAARETDTFDTFFESSWYFDRFCSPRAETAFERQDVDYWMPVDQYIGGIEHAVLHLLYSRFFSPRAPGVAAISTSRSLSPGSSPRAWSATRPTAPRTANGSSPRRSGATRAARRSTRKAGRSSPGAREDEQVEEERRRPRGDRRGLRRRHGAALSALRQPARARPRMDRCRHRGRLALRQPPAPAGERAAGGAGAAGRGAAADAGARRREDAPRHPPRHRCGHRPYREVPFQQRRGAHPRAHQSASRRCARRPAPAR